MKRFHNFLLFQFAICLIASMSARRSFAMDGMGGMDSAHATRSATGGMDSSTSLANLTLAVRDGDSVWIVRVTLIGLDSTGKKGPLPNVTVSFFVQRLFGNMPMRDDDNTAATDDSGNAEIQMPKNIPGGSTGMLTIIARIEGNDQRGPVEVQDSGRWGGIVPIVADPFPRALWEPSAPIAMVITFSILFGGVWATYGFVVTQLVNIKKDKHNEVS